MCHLKAPRAQYSAEQYPISIDHHSANRRLVLELDGTLQARSLRGPATIGSWVDPVIRLL